LEAEVRKHRVASLMNKAVGASKEGALGGRLRECEDELQRANEELARLRAELGACQRELERTRDEAAAAAEMAKRTLAESQTAEREASADAAAAHARVRQTESWLRQWDEHARRQGLTLVHFSAQPEPFLHCFVTVLSLKPHSTHPTKSAKV